MRLDTTADILSFIRKRREILLTQGKNIGFSGLATASRNLVHTLENQESVLAMDSQTDIAPEIDTTKMSAKFIVSTACKDRHGDIVEPDGCLPHLKNYARNPRIFFAHRTDDLPIASARDAEGNLCLEVDKENGIIRSTAWFHGETPESELIFRLIARKELQAASIGFLPVRAAVIHTDNTEASTSEGNTIVDFRNMGHPIMHFLEWDMIEWSVVPIPANQEALAAHLGRGHIEGEKITPAVRRALAAWIPPKQKTIVPVSFSPITYVAPQGPTPGLEALAAEVENKKQEVVSLAVDKKELNKVYSKYKKETNMSFKELKKWSEHPCSKKASLSSGPIKRNLELLSTEKDSWTDKHITWANKTIAFNSRMQKMPKGKPTSKDCPWSKRDISLKNWAFDPNKSSKDKDLDALIPPPKQPSDKKALSPSVNSTSAVGSKKEIGLKVKKAKKLFSDSKELHMAYEDDEDKKKKKKPSEEDEEVKDVDEDDEEDKDIDEDDTDEEAAKAIDEEDKDEGDDEEKDVDEEEKDTEEEDTTKILKGMSEVMNNMHECAMAHTDILKSLHDKMDDMHKSKKAQEAEEEKNEEEEERKSILSALTTLKSNQDSLNKKLFELTGRK